MYCPLYFGFTNKNAWPARLTYITRPPSCGTIVTFTHRLLLSCACQPSKSLDSMRQAAGPGVCAIVCRGKKLAHSTAVVIQNTRDGVKKGDASACFMKISAIW